MTDIKDLSTEQKLAELTGIVTDYFSIISDASRTLSAAFNAVSTERFQERMWELTQGLASDLGVAVVRQKNGGVSVVDLIENITEAAEKKSMDTKGLRAILPDYRATCDAAKALIPDSYFDLKDAERKALDKKILGVVRNHLLGKTKGGPKQ